MSDVISLAENAARERGIKPLYIGIMKVVDESNNVRSSLKNVIVISKTNLLVFDADPFKFLKRHSWIQLNHISYQDKTIQLQFDQDRYNWHSNEIYLVLPPISESIQQILKYTELKKLNFSPYKDQVFKPSANSALQRARSYISNNKLTIDEKSFNNFENIFYTSQISVKILNISIQDDICSLIADSLPLYPNLLGIEVSKIHNVDTFEIAKAFAKERCSIEYMSIEGEVTSTFNRFVSSLKHNRSIPIHGIGFSNSNFTEANLDRLKELITRKNIRSLTFNKSITTRAMKHFCNSFLNSEIGDNLVYLNLNYSTNITLSLILPNIISIQYLSLEGCNLDIVKSLISISKYRFPNLVALNLSNNQCENSVGMATIKLPPSIESFSMNNITWGSDSFVTFLDLIFSTYKNGLKLSISNAQMDYDSWTNVFDFLGSIPYFKLSSLVWDNNPIVQPFIEFLENNENISYLSLNSCFEGSNFSIFKQFLQGLKLMKNLTSLSIRGHNTKTISKFLKDFVDSILNSKIEFLDTSNNGGGEDSLTYYEDLLLEPSSLRVLVLDGLNPTDAERFKDFLEVATDSNVFMSFPFDDSEYLVKNGQIAREDIKEFMVIMNLAKSSSEMLNVFYEEECPSFPLYVVPENIPQISQKTPEKVKFEKPKSPVREKRLFELASYSEAKTLDPDLSLSKSRQRHHSKKCQPKIVDIIYQTRKEEIPVKSPKFANEIVQLGPSKTLDPEIGLPPEPEQSLLCTSVTNDEQQTDDDGRSGAATVGDPMTLGEAVTSQVLNDESYNPKNIHQKTTRRERISLFNIEIDSDEDELPKFVRQSQDDESDQDAPMQTMLMETPAKQQEEPQQRRHRRRRRKKETASQTKNYHDQFNWEFPNMNQNFEEEEEEDIWENLDRHFSFDSNFDEIRNTPPYYVRKK
ncbi:hypothetical protein TVAG_174090 [Trichomonas vaginalis G3]|uniref:Leucine Rich Repeat family protein n=1 Tax=Trichomonas vaginalis (strain ATCC PRA-98 / G3) TaxID=412133 RepID=A2EWV2_TRIV3|nr:leucine-rich repeat, isoform f-related family [Trichomonas vaginalis G3]EAY02867.1 hypothetical protein TVAG_174090 [Trichomonas vaginalis G3]KAI5497381.1 leucine-rich repeat, isoform f-related family [Trichomonas vaginalis G3]|eukprot:XP_001315090.1 hypothetical protein [Trichomonas vaginalis G3]